MTEEELQAARFRAYQIWDREGRPHGRDEKHWHQAISELGLHDINEHEARKAIAAQAREWDEAEKDSRIIGSGQFVLPALAVTTTGINRQMQSH